MISSLIPKDSRRRKLAKKAALNPIVLPKNSRRIKLLRRIVASFDSAIKSEEYSGWVAEQKDKIEFFETKQLKTRPLISIVVPAYNTPKKYLYPLIYSVVGQLYDNWELVLVNVSTDIDAKKDINDCANIDTRIKILEKENEGISANTNYGIKNAKGTYIAFMDHDDTLNLNALYEVAKAINQDNKVGLIYSDEDKLSEDGSKYLQPHFKPDWSPDLLTHVNYITHLTVIKKSLVEKVGMLDPKKDGAQDYDLILKVTDLKPRVIHIHQVLYHWRIAEKSTADDVSNKPYIKKAGERALKDHYDRMGVKAEVKALDDKPGFYKTKFKTKKQPIVIVPPFSNHSIIAKYLRLLEKKGVISNYRVIVPSEKIELTNNKVELVDFDNYVEFLKKAVNKADDHVVVLSDFIVPDKASWAREISDILELKHVHAVAPVILRQNASIEDLGIVKNGHEKLKLFRGYMLGINTYFGDTDWTRDVSSLSGAVMAFRKHDFLKFIGKNPIKTKNILHRYSSSHKDRYNVVYPSAVCFHVRSSQMTAESEFKNMNIQRVGPDLELSPNDQQIVDAIEALEKAL